MTIFYGYLMLTASLFDSNADICMVLSTMLNQSSFGVPTDLRYIWCSQCWLLPDLLVPDIFKFNWVLFTYQLDVQVPLS